MVENSKIFARFPAGPLDMHRGNASFDWYEMKRYMDGEELLAIKEEAWSVLAKDPLFQKSERGLSIEEKRRLTFLRLKRLVEYNLFGDIIGNPMSIYAMTDTIGSISWSLFAKFQLHFQVDANFA